MKSQPISVKSTHLSKVDPSQQSQHISAKSTHLVKVQRFPTIFKSLRKTFEVLLYQTLRYAEVVQKWNRTLFRYYPSTAFWGACALVSCAVPLGKPS